MQKLTEILLKVDIEPLKESMVILVLHCSFQLWIKES